MGEYKYKKVDAFTSGRSYGNPAAVLYLEDGQELTPLKMQEIAKLHKGAVSEVVYCKSKGEDGLELCYYSSECEVDFCGHGTIACMYSLVRNSPKLYAKEKITIDTARKGKLTVYNKIAEQDAVYITAPSPVYSDCSIPKEEIAKALDLTINQLGEGSIELVNAGLNTLIAQVASLQAEITVFPDEPKLKQFCLDNHVDIILIYSSKVQDKIHHAHTRVFAPLFGYLEDPATGSGNSAFGYYMLKNGLWDGKPISIEQGGCDRIFNVVKLDYYDNKVLFGGSATDRIVGVYLY
jgi:PhzF family phenazine biosynthesis protein